MAIDAGSLTFARMVLPMVPSVCRISQWLREGDQGD